MADTQKYQADLDRFITNGRDISEALAESDSRRGLSPDLATEYQRWYTESSRLVKQILPERSNEFTTNYARDEIYRITNDSAEDDYSYVISARDRRALVLQLRLQNDLLESAKSIFTSSLSDIKAVVQADLFDSELDGARELLRKGFLRPAGVVAGVVLERYLAQVAANHALTTRKKNPTINDFNELLKEGGIVDVPAWRQLQHLGDLRNLCGHNKDREPTKEEVDELIDGVEKYTKTLF